VLPRVRLEPLIISVAVHPGCGDARVGESGVFFEVARTLAPGAEIPATSHCCGMAGMHGVRYPEVPRTALAPMRDELRNAGKRVVVTGNELCARAIERGTEVPAITLLQLAGIATGLLQAPTLEKPGSSR
jgi:D-lactate dehydrogenase